MRLRTLGQCVIEIGETRLGPDAELLFALALYLAAHGGRRLSRGAVAGLLWPEADEQHGAHSLRQALYRLRALGAAIGSDRSHVWVEAAHAAADFARLLASSGAEPDEMAAVVGGPFLPGYAPTFSEPFAEWVDRQRDIVNAGVRRVLVGAIASRRTHGDWGAVAALAARCLAVDPLNEEATLASAEAAALQGGKSQALAILDRYLKDIGPGAREIRIPATVLRRRIAEAPHFERPAPLGEVPFVGRSAEMAALNRALQEAQSGRGAAHLVWGEPGIGKTRLAQEFSRGALFQPVRVVRIGCQSGDERRPLSAFVDLVPKLMALPGALGCAPESMRYLRRMVEHTGHESLPTPDTREAALLYANIRRSLFDILDALAGESCLVLVLEDAHWLDTMSWQVIAEAVPWMASRRLLLLLTSRTPDPERAGGLAELAGVQRWPLGPLPEGASRALVEALVAGSGVAARAELATWCLANGGGNPYYLCELALHGLQSSGAFEVPASLTALIADRLTRLRPVPLRVLQACAVLGKHSTLERLELLLEQRRVDLLDSLDELEAHGLVASDGARVHSRHDLLSQAALARLSTLSRRLLHRHVALLLEDAATEPQSAALLWDCAEHWQRAGETGRALRFLRSCARHAIEMGLPAEAAAILERAASLAREAVEREEVLREYAYALRLAGRWEQVLETLQSIRHLRAERDEPIVAHDDDELTVLEAKWRGGSPIAGVFNDLCACVSTSGVGPNHRVRAATLALMLADNLCECQAAHAVFASVSPLLTAVAVDRAVAYQLEIVYHTAFGQPAAAESAARSLLDLVRSRGDVVLLIHSLQAAVRAFRCAGSLTEAEVAATDAFALAERHHLGSSASSAANSLANLRLAADDLDGARQWNERARHWALATEDQLAICNSLDTEARIVLKEGYLDDAEALHRESVRASRNCIHPRLEARSRALLIRIALERDGVRPSETQIGQLIDLYQRTRHCAGHDGVVVALYNALMSCGRCDEGALLVREYLSTYRRDGVPVDGALREIASTIRDLADSASELQGV